MIKIFSSTILLLYLVVFFSACSKDDEELSNTESFKEYIEDEMDIQNIPAMSVVLFKENTVLFEGYFGKSNLDQDLAIANNHLFLLASISKVVTATALLQLYEDGLFSLNDQVNDYLPFVVNVPNQSTNITFQMLLTHTSGIADGSALDNQYYYGVDPPVELDFFLENYLSIGGSFYNASENFHDFEPGTGHEYSNVGNALIGLLVEEISGLNFNDYCKQNIFTPLGMTNTAWRLDEITQTIVTPYNYEDNDFEAIQNYTFTDYPNGGLRSTGLDMFKFLKAFTQNGLSNNFQLLQASTINQMQTLQIPNLDDSMGLHLFIMNAQKNLWGHDGGEQGVATIMAYNPDTKVGAIILSNQGEADLDNILVKAYDFGLEL